jgi:hypothetical protein
MTSDQVIELLSLVGINAKLIGKEIVSHCPFAKISGHSKGMDRNPSLGFVLNEEYGAIWSCFGCKRSGILKTFFQLLELEAKIPTGPAISRLQRILEKRPEEIGDSIPEYDALFDRQKTPQYPTFDAARIAPYLGTVPNYLLSRGIDLATAKCWRLGYDQSSHRALFPVWDKNEKLVGAVGRLTREMEGARRYINYWHEDGFKTGFFCYGEHFFDSFHRMNDAVVIEGMIDVLKVYQAVRPCTSSVDINKGSWGSTFPLGLFGSNVTKFQVEKIISLTRRKVIAFFDNDEAGEKGFFRLKELIGNRVPLLKVVYPDSDIPLDPGMLAPQQIRRMIETAQIT